MWQTFWWKKRKNTMPRHWQMLEALRTVVRLSVRQFVTQRRSVAKSVGCFHRRLFVCQHDNFPTSKHRMMKVGGGEVHCTKISAEFEFGSHNPLGAQCTPQKCGVRLQRLENQRRLSSLLVRLTVHPCLTGAVNPSVPSSLYVYVSVVLNEWRHFIFR